MPWCFLNIKNLGSYARQSADDDPRTAELISKVLLLVRDEDLPDPIILEQIRAMA